MRFVLFFHRRLESVILVLNRFSGRFNFHQFRPQLLFSVIFQDSLEAQAANARSFKELTLSEGRPDRKMLVLMALLLARAEDLAVILGDVTELDRSLS